MEVSNMDKGSLAEIPANPAYISPLLIGETVPTIILPDASGKSFNSNESIIF